MYNYANKVDIAVNDFNKEVVLSFKQISPVFKDESPDENGEPKVSTTMQLEEIASIVMTKDFASTLKDLLNKML